MNKSIKRVNIEEITSPDFLKNYSNNDLKTLSGDIRKYIIDSVEKNGGHLSSNLGVIDATISLCKNFNFPKDKIIFDVGHQSYTYKILTGRKLDNLRQKDGISGFQKISESKYDCYEAGHSSTSISAANGMAIARDLNKEKYEIIAFIGDGAIMNGLAFEGLNLSSLHDHKIIIVLNDNEMSITKPVGGLAKVFRKFSTSTFYMKAKNAYRKLLVSNKVGRKIYSVTSNIKNFVKSKILRLNFFDYLGYKFIGPIDGHDFKMMDKAFAKAKKIDRSCVIHLKTIKGKGMKNAEEDVNGIYHGISSIKNEEKLDCECVSWTSIYERLLFDALQKNSKTFAIVPATGTGSGLIPLFKKFKGRILDVGISEEHAFTMASGLSCSGYHPIISIYSTFFQRAYDQFNHDLARLNCHSTILIDRAGLVGQDGETHQGVFDASLVYPISNTVIAMASNYSEAQSLMIESLNNHGVFFIRYPKEKLCHPILKTNEVMKFGQWKEIVLSKTTNKVIVSFGPVVNEIKHIIETNNIDCSLVNAIYQKPLNIEMIKKLTRYEEIIILDIYSTKEGFVLPFMNVLNELNYKGKITCKCIENKFIKQATIKEQKEEMGLSIDSITKLIA
ncbi:MAG: 1-deoxy-D-xylulose-5-phosphate synthase [Bacilli bacterium]